MVLVTEPPPELTKCAINKVEFVIDEGSMISEVSASSAPKCQAACAAEKDCEAWVSNTEEGECTLSGNIEGNIEDIKEDDSYISGFMECESDSKFRGVY